MSDDFDCSSSEHVVFLVVQRLTWGHDYRLAGVDPKRVNVFHVAYLQRIADLESFPILIKYILKCHNPTVMQLSNLSLTTSYSISFHPFKDLSIMT